MHCNLCEGASPRDSEKLSLSRARASTCCNPDSFGALGFRLPIKGNGDELLEAAPNLDYNMTASQ